MLMMGEVSEDDLLSAFAEQAQALDMQAVGTMGHEHVQRWGDDLQAFRAMRDMRPGAPSYLLDTFDTIVSGIPAAVQVARERAHPFSIRYDSGDKYAQYLYAHGAFDREDLRPIHIIEDGLDAEATARFEELRRFTGVASDHQIYGYGGYLVSRSWRNPLTRDAVAAVYKLSSTSGAPRMKFGNERGLGKVSIPGEPVVWRRLPGRATRARRRTRGPRPRRPRASIHLNQICSPRGSRPSAGSHTLSLRSATSCSCGTWLFD